MRRFVGMGLQRQPQHARDAKRGLGSLRVSPIMPAAPPKKAISTSQMVGAVRASSSEEASDSGVIRKYSVATARLIPTNIPIWCR